MKNDDWFDDSCSNCGEFAFKESNIPGLCQKCVDAAKRQDEEGM